MKGFIEVNTVQGYKIKCHYSMIYKSGVTWWCVMNDWALLENDEEIKQLIKNAQ